MGVVRKDQGSGDEAEDNRGREEGSEKHRGGLEDVEGRHGWVVA